VGDAFVYLSDERIYLAINHEYDDEAWYIFSSFAIGGLTTPLVSMFSYQGDNTIQQFAGSEIDVGVNTYSNFFSCSTDNANFATEGIVIEIQTVNLDSPLGIRDMIFFLGNDFKFAN